MQRARNGRRGEGETRGGRETGNEGGRESSRERGSEREWRETQKEDRDRKRTERAREGDQDQEGVWEATKQSTPHIKYAGGELIELVQGAEQERILRQPQLLCILRLYQGSSKALLRLY